ncbi:class I adenylate-forming enzyme family protein [Pasteurella atlantica]|uniref:Class I adenylate-forming enzyme family protein n=2 Tax=Pasteurellaceae TaxID=712 RepID=A0ACC6HK21_9PAST|nr:class I adenylate-forming enzyme family protein [Pasteurella atlantica]MDP8051216.1 class I adenylate-forming enzyme family protein [Pasteurella atlantica]MDP8104511.1 class I adenylate-forming enzyme family protein [Pasteurella atlantica]MDP8147936.1 class I adenylate-forming enzyme family protein [Pasteurella atlantica]
MITTDFNSQMPIAFNPQLSYNEFNYRSLQITAQLKQQKIKQVSLWFEDAVNFACTLLACFNTNVNVLIPPNLLNENKQWVEQNSDLLIDDNIFADFGILQKVDKILPLVDEQNQTEIWLKTSGSSGSAKIIKKTAQQMWLEAQALIQALPFQPEDKLHLISSVTVQHCYGLSFRIFLPLAMGWTIGRHQLHYPEYLLEESRQIKPTLWVSSPALLSRLNLANKQLQNNEIKGIISSGGALSDRVAQDIRELIKQPVIEIYGSTETGAIAFRETGNWTAMPSVELGLNVQGALWVEGNWITGREQTADAVEFSNNGFQLLGRIDRIVKLGDKRISLAKIEQDLLKHQWISDCYIAQHPEKQRPVAWVALNSLGISQFQLQDRKQFINELRQFLMQTQESLALPRFWRFCSQLPRNSQSKISRTDFETICFKQQKDHFE